MRQSNSPEPALLGFLLDGPMHGYDLYKQVNAHLGLMWHIGMSQMYAIVNAYVVRGWIHTQVQSQELRPARKLLEITPAGREAFEEWLHQPAHGLREFRLDFFLRLYSARTLGAPAIQALVDQQVESVRDELENLNKHRKSAVEESELVQLTRDFRIQQLTTILKWLESNRAQLIRLAKSRNVASARRPSPRRKKADG
jgi:DNA-binding PadR family transcriptional regulator